MSGIGKTDWLPGDRERQSMTGKKKEEKVVSFDRRASYGPAYAHDVDWYEKVKPGESRYVTAFREAWDPEAQAIQINWEDERLRLIRKKEARRSVIVSGLDDFWVEELQDPQFYILTNMRGGRKLIRFRVPKRELAGLWDLLLP